MFGFSNYKKTNHVRESFLLFSQLQNIYQHNPDYLKNFYSYFARKYVLRQKFEKKQKLIEEKLLDLNQYGNYIFIIITNK